MEIVLFYSGGQDSSFKLSIKVKLENNFIIRKLSTVTIRRTPCCPSKNIYHIAQTLKKSLFVCSSYLLRVSVVCFALYLLQLCPVTQERHSSLSINEANFWDPSLEKSTFKQITNENCTICTQQYLERITVRPYDLLRSLPIAYLCAKLDFATLERQFETVFNPSSSR